MKTENEKTEPTNSTPISRKLVDAQSDELAKQIVILIALCPEIEIADIISQSIRPIFTRIDELRKAAQLAQLNYRRTNQSNPELMGDDEHEAWTALNKALAAGRGS